MKQSILFMSFFFLLGLRSVSAQDHSHHARHNMVVFGETEIFASHLVYKTPHNFQVILKIKLPQQTKNIYLEERIKHPTEDVIFLLDQFDMKEMESQDQISGSLFLRKSDGEKIMISPELVLNKSDFEIIYFNELPLSLGKD